MKNTKNVIILTKEQVDNLLKLKKHGFSRKELKSEDGSYFLENTNTLLIHDLAYMNRNYTEEEFIELVTSIAQKGQLVPITLYRGKVVDGRHRLLALKYLKVDYVKCIKLPNNYTLNDVKEYIMNVEKRRHDNNLQKNCRYYLQYLQEKDKYESLNEFIKVNSLTSNIKKINKIAEILGIETIRIAYNFGKVKIDNKYYSSINSLYTKALDIKKEMSNFNKNKQQAGLEIIEDEKIKNKLEKMLEDIDNIIDAGYKDEIIYIISKKIKGIKND